MSPLQDRLNDINGRREEAHTAPQQDLAGSFPQAQSPAPSATLSSARRSSSLQARLLSHSEERTESGSILANVNRELAQLEKRDWELWWIVCATGLLMGGGLIAVLLPAAFMKTENFHFEVTVPRQLVVGLMVLLILINTYLVTRRIDLRRLRQKMVSSTIQNELVRLQSFTDPLTEIYNRRSLEDLVTRYVSHARRLKKPLTFLLIDLRAGDFVLVEIAGLLRNSIRGCDAVIRYGGDEFLVIVSDASAVEATKVVDRMHNSVSEWNKGAHLEGCNISLSIGVAEWIEGKTIDEVLDLADQDMYARKAASAAQSPPNAHFASSAS